LGQEIARRGQTLVYGGGRVGLMGVVAEAALTAGGRVIGVIPEGLLAKEIAAGDVTELHVVGTMHERKAMMADFADAFIALPGGFGTCDELFEILTWSQIGLHRKPVGLVDTLGFFGPLLAWADHLMTEGFVKPTHRQLILRSPDPVAILDLLASAHPPPATQKWLTPDER
jgi:uncharacterized protein (TIGR00730 family)